MSFGVFPSPGGKPAPRPKAPVPKVQVPPVSIGRGPAPVPPRMMPPRMPAPQPSLPPPAMPPTTPKLPYGGPITMPGQQLPPNVQIGGGPAPVPGMPIPGMPGGKSGFDPDMFTKLFGTPGQKIDPGQWTSGNDMYTGGPSGYDPMQAQGGGAKFVNFDQPLPFGSPQNNPMPPSMYTQPQPNFADAVGTTSPFLNSVQR